MNIVFSDNPDFEKLWTMAFDASPSRHPLYQPRNLEYYRILASRYGDTEQVDRSFVTVENDQPVLALRMTMGRTRDGIKHLSCFTDLPVFYSENDTAGIKLRRKARAALKSELDGIIDENDIQRIWYEDFFPDNDLTYFGKILLDRGAKAQPLLRCIIDLEADEAEMFRQVRKSYKSLINWGRNNLALSIRSGPDFSDDEIERFRALHIHVAGRETRTRETWLLQAEMIRRGEAFAVFGELNGDLVTAALFPVSSRYCFYGVSASKRELFDKPMSHVILWEAVLHAKNMGCRYFEMGPILFPNLGDPPPTPKELSIGLFKHGFGGRTEPRLNIVWDRDQQP